MRERNYFASAMVETGLADVMISGLTRSYKDSIRPALRVIGVEDGLNKIAGMYILISKDGPMFFADTTININPSVEEIVDITLLVANTLIFPNLSSGNIAYKLVKEMSQNEAIGPILLGMKKPVHVLQIGSSVREILNMITLGVVDVQNRK